MKYFVLAVLKAYQVTAPIWKGFVWTASGVKPECKFTPSCSEYTVQQILTHGTIPGLKKGWQQFSKCR